LATIKKFPVYDRVRDGFIAFFGRSEDYREANTRAKLIESFEPYSQKQVMEILRFFLDNPQIWGAYNAQDIMDEFVKKHSSQIPPRIRRVYRTQRRAS